MSDFTTAICEVMTDREVTSKYPEGLSPSDILSEVWKKHPGEFSLCTVIDVCHEKDAMLAAVRAIQPS
jgi:hypothetical protein